MVRISRQAGKVRRGPQVLHHLGAVIGLAGRSAIPAGEEAPTPMERRRRQHLALARRLLHPLPSALGPEFPQAERFWQALRWGGGGMLLAWWLAR